MKLNTITLIAVFVALGLALILSTGFISFMLDAEAEMHTHRSLYENSDVDFVVLSPSIEQVEDYNQLSHIEAMVPFYRYTVTVNVAEQNVEYSLYMLEDNFDLKDTPYNDERLIKEIKSTEREIYIDYRFHQENGVFVGDTLDIPFGNNSVTFTVTRIYETNTALSQGGMLTMFDTDYIDMIQDVNPDYEAKYSGAYIASNDLNATKHYLEANYLPLGSLRDREEFMNDHYYNEYLNFFYDEDHASNIFQTQKSYQSLLPTIENLNNYRTNQMIYTVLFTFLAVLLINALYLKTSYVSIKKRFIQGQDIITALKRFGVFNGAFLGVVIFALILLTTLLANQPVFYLPTSQVVLMIFTISMIMIGIVAIFLIIEAIFLSVIYGSLGSKRKNYGHKTNHKGKP